MNTVVALLTIFVPVSCFPQTTSRHTVTLPRQANVSILPRVKSLQYHWSVKVSRTNVTSVECTRRWDAINGDAAFQCHALQLQVAIPLKNAGRRVRLEMVYNRTAPMPFLVIVKLGV